MYSFMVSFNRGIVGAGKYEGIHLTLQFFQVILNYALGYLAVDYTLLH
jgi:hypothetical protein